MSREKHLKTESAPDEATAFAARRKVIKGLASTIPVALTLSNGAAMANASSHQCVTAEQAFSEPACVTEDPAGGSSGWAYSEKPITPTDTSLPSRDPKYCVAYAQETPDNQLEIIGYNYDYTDQSGVVQRIFIDHNGDYVNGNDMAGNPLTASCGGSFV